MNSFYTGIVIAIAINAILTTLGGILSIGNALFNIPSYIIITGVILTCLLISIYLYKLKKIPQLNVYQVIIVTMLYIFPKDFLIELNKDELNSYLNMSRYIDVVKYLFFFILLVAAYFKGKEKLCGTKI